ncbi:MAG: lysoplasmalogenase [Bacteroidota bacterium]
MKTFFRYAFFAVAFLVLLAELISSTLLYQVSKPLIMVTLLAYYLSAQPALQRSLVLIIALLFSWAGDVLLMFSGDLFFMLGLSGFLLSHVFYVVAYRQHKKTDGVGFLGVQKARYSFPFILVGTGLLTILYPVLGPMKVPVTAYAAVLVAMALAALFRFGFTSTRSFGWVLTGAILFLVSDSTLAINKFLQPVPYSGLLIMSTYMAAQYMIVEGLLAHKE